MTADITAMQASRNGMGRATSKVSPAGRIVRSMVVPMVSGPTALAPTSMTMRRP
jgi:hypothetical protein